MILMTKRQQELFPLWLSKSVGSSLRFCDGDWLCTGGLMSFLHRFQGDWAARALPKLCESETTVMTQKSLDANVDFHGKRFGLVHGTSFSWVTAGAQGSLGLSCGGSNPSASQFCCQSTYSL